MNMPIETFQQKILITIPPLPGQQKIVTFLTTLNDKIAAEQTCIVQKTTQPLGLATQFEKNLEK